MNKLLPENKQVDLLTFPKPHILDSSKLKDDDFKFDVNGRKVSTWVENNVGKGEIACDEQFLLFPLDLQGDPQKMRPIDI